MRDVGSVSNLLQQKFDFARVQSMNRQHVKPSMVDKELFELNLFYIPQV